ncbi:transporter substrate-binding domain-containing protein [Aeromonas salmonicida]|uniref:transporter substrate-binding domain-containing protein n=1 Tax=Aeromonas salmonicida TaxID=645 RepID=UPI0022405C09|nr:transporter substrate-binding domain-containing protein [Aeromonas salmonicida]MDM5063182.1 transporter substrate-binding domain-containing protein [Aeromonas salmonicida]
MVAAFQQPVTGTGHPLALAVGTGNQDKILGEGVAVALRKNDDKLKSRFNAAIESVKADGTFDTLLKKYQLDELL